NRVRIGSMSSSIVMPIMYHLRFDCYSNFLTVPKSNLLRFLKLISASAQGRFGKYVESLGGMEPIVWDGAVTAIKFDMNTAPKAEAWS
ncbi:MAG: hypothetical protein L0Y39_02695, partial [Methylococcaceae bacterium]|nr:hypothetical protein [Methylococcaceae bacterium]